MNEFNYTNGFLFAEKISLQKIAEEIGDKFNIGLLARNIGNLYYHKGDIDKASEYYTRSRNIDEELGNKSRIGNNN